MPTPQKLSRARGDLATTTAHDVPLGAALKRARVLLADDHAELLAVATRLLQTDFDVVKTVGDGEALLAEAFRIDPDLIVLDISMPLLGGIDAARQLRQAGSRAKMVFVTVHQDPDYVSSALAAGGQGYVVKSRLASDLTLALGEVLAGRSFISPSLVPTEPPPARD